MIHELKFESEKTPLGHERDSARGRNGWFVPVGAIGYYAEPHPVSLNEDPDSPGALTVEVYSKQRGGFAPILLSLTPANAVKLRDLLTDCIADSGQSLVPRRKAVVV